MPKKAQELSPLEVKRITKPGLHMVGGVAGLGLQVTERGARTWVLRILVGGKRRDAGLGGYPDVALAEAREKASKFRAAVDEGRDPIQERRDAKAKLLADAVKRKTFDEAAAMYITDMKAPELRNAKHLAQWASTLGAYASPSIGALPVDMVEKSHVVDLLRPIWLEKHETARRLRQRVEAVLAFAAAKEWRSGDNPAKLEALKDLLPSAKKVKKVEHHPALPIDEMGRFMVDLRQRKGMAARALEFVILTACRSGEARMARWSEIDLDNRLWTVPPETAKAGIEHRVALSDDAVALLNELPRFAGADLVFPSPTGGVMSDATLAAVVKRMHADGGNYTDPKRGGRVVVPHGFRSTFKDWASDRTAYPWKVVEAALAHKERDKTAAAYGRSDLLERRRPLMTDWARFAGSPRPAGAVVPLRAAL